MSARISTYVLTMDSSLPCISHIASLRQNNMIAWKGRPRCLHMKTKRAVKLIIIITIISTSYIGSLFVAISSTILLITHIPRYTLSRSFRSSSPLPIFVCFHSSYYQETSYFRVSSPIFYQHSMTSSSVTSFPVTSSNIKYISDNLSICIFYTVFYTVCSTTLDLCMCICVSYLLYFQVTCIRKC